MTLSADYPRMMFHRQLEPVIVQSEEEEAALGGEWSRTIPLPGTQEPPPPPPEEPEPEEPEEEPEEPAEKPPPPRTPQREPRKFRKRS